MSGRRLDAAASVAMLVASVIMVTVAGYLVWTRSKTDGNAAGDTRRSPRPEGSLQQIFGSTVDLSETTVSGSQSALVGMLLYTDMECPFCRRLATEVLPEVRRRYVDTGKAFLAIKHLPIVELHPLAFDLAKAVECGGQQGKAWELHDAIMSVGGKAVIANPSRVVEGIGLSAPDRFMRCWSSPEAAASVTRDLAEAQRLGITGTPMLLFGSRESDRFRISGAQAGFAPLEAIAARLDRALELAYENQQR